MFCRNCGNQLADGVAFCEKCGYKIGSDKIKKSFSLNLNSLFKDKEPRFCYSVIVLACVALTVLCHIVTSCITPAIPLPSLFFIIKLFSFLFCSGILIFPLLLTFANRKYFKYFGMAALVVAAMQLIFSIVVVALLYNGMYNRYDFMSEYFASILLILNFSKMGSNIPFTLIVFFIEQILYIAVNFLSGIFLFKLSKEEKIEDDNKDGSL